MTRSTRRQALASTAGAFATARVCVGFMSGLGAASHDSSRIDGDQGYVMMQFDDYPDPSHASLALPVMDDHDVPGVVGVVTDRVNKDDEFADLDALVRAGWEVASHTRTHEDLGKASPSEARDQCDGSREWIDVQGYDNGDTSIIYPYSSVDDDVTEIARESYTFGFGGHDEPPGWDDPLAIGRVKGHESDAVDEALDRASREGETVILMYHEIVQSGASDNQVDVDELERVVERIDEDGGLEPIVPTQYEDLLDKGGDR